MSLSYDFQKWIIISLILVTTSLIVGLVLVQFGHGQEWNTTGQIEQDIHNFTRTAQNGTQYICQENSAGQVLGCSPISGSEKAIPVSAKGPEKLENAYFSINIPDNWAYVERSNTPEAKNTGFGPVNTIELTPGEFSDILASGELREKIQDGGAYAQFLPDIDYPKNAPLESYVKYQINNYGISNITSQQYATVGNEKSVRIYANESAFYGNNTKIALYLVMHDKEPYRIIYVANAKNYEKYLPEFEEIVKSFRFVGSLSSETQNLSENENVTNTPTNFSGADLNRPYIGVVGLSLTPDLSKQIGLNQTKGFLITSITKGSPADKSGLRAGTNTTTINGRDVDVGGDIILKVDNREVSTWYDILAYPESQKRAGDKIHVTILRDNAIRELDVILGQMPIQPTSQNANDKNQEELYDECVRVAGQSLCDFLFKR
jgi:hypothetical protein